MDIVIPFEHSINNDEELRYALRSAEKWIPMVDRVIIAGPAPVWEHQNLIVLDLDNTSRNKAVFANKNQVVKLLRACDSGEVGNNFIILHDDNFLMKPFLHDTYYHCGDNWYGTGWYAETEKNTRLHFSMREQLIKNFDVHAPHAVNRDEFIKAMREVNWNKPYGYCIKTLYGGYCNIEGDLCNDLKFRSGILDYTDIIGRAEQNPFFSISDTAFKLDVKLAIKNLYPNPSRYEVQN